MALHPRSLLQLTLFGFGLVALPPIGGLVYTAVHLQRLSAQSQEAVFRAVTATRASSALVEKVTDMERVVRQYQVVGELPLLDLYRRTYADFSRTTTELANLPLDDVQRQRLQHLTELAEQVRARLADTRPEAEAVPIAVHNLTELSNLSRAVLSDSKALIEREVKVMESTAANTQYFLYWQALALGPTALLLAGLFVVLINRPIRQVDTALRRLGDGEFATPVATVRGPRDLRELGERLDWLRRRLVELEEEKTKFLHQVSHELKTPLTALREGTDLLAEGVVGELSSDQIEIVAILKSNAATLQRLIEDLLNFNLARSEHGTLLETPVFLDALIREVAADHRPAMIAKGLTTHLALARVTLRGDAKKLRVVIDNLLSNAVKFSPQDGILVLRLERHGETVVLEVEDSGSGIAVEERDKVFEAFYQGRHAGGGHLKGTGIGLSIAWEYVHAHGGYIEAVSPRDLHGACLRVTLPIGSLATISRNG
ncbi:two-component system, NtrC family, sensor histidine kinase GlrK [Gammaproteobacteria bacterium]